MTTTFSTIEDLFSHSTVQIQSTAGLGTGFFFEFDVPTENKKIPCIITNKHVSHDQSATRQITFHCQNKEGQLIEAERLDIPNELWNRVDHPKNDVDLCAILLDPILTSIASKEFSIFCPCLNKDNLILDEELKKLTPVNDILMVGYPIGLIDNINNFPIFHRGITASHPGLSFT